MSVVIVLSLSNCIYVRVATNINSCLVKSNAHVFFLLLSSHHSIWVGGGPGGCVQASLDRTGQDRIVEEETGSETDCGEAVRDGGGGAAVVGGEEGDRGGGEDLEIVGGGGVQVQCITKCCIVSRF